MRVSGSIDLRVAVHVSLPVTGILRPTRRVLISSDLVGQPDSLCLGDEIAEVDCTHRGLPELFAVSG